MPSTIMSTNYPESPSGITAIGLKKSAGIMFVTALLNVPAATALNFSLCLKSTINFSVIFSFISVIGNIFFFFTFSFPPQEL